MPEILEEVFLPGRHSIVVSGMHGKTTTTAMLAWIFHVAGKLDPTMGGPDIDQAQGLTSRRRSLYLRNAAEKEVEFLKIFDGPSVTECYARRPSVVPQQALALANQIGDSNERSRTVLLTAEAMARAGKAEAVPAAREFRLGGCPSCERCCQ